MQDFPSGRVVKNPPADASDTGDMGSIPGLGGVPLRREMAIHFSILAWKMLWTEEPSRL